MRQAITTTLFFIMLYACTEETIVIPDNDPPFVGSISSIKIENYINKLFIDNVGREPSDEEMVREVKTLEAAELSEEAREALIDKLQTSAEFVEGDTSYQHAYFQQLYSLTKIRCLEGASDEQLLEFIEDAETQSDIDRIYAVLNIKKDLMEGNIQMHEALARAVFNLQFDEINMNTFNFVNATFDNLLWRFPSDAEFNSAYDMVENNRSNILFGKAGQSKGDYIAIVKESRELFEGMIIWVYQQLLARRPSTQETVNLLNDFYDHRDIRLVQKAIMVTDEYAGF